MNKLNCMMMAGALLATACQPTGKTGDIIGKQSVKVENGIMTTEVLMAFGRVSDPVVSPDKSKILFGVTYENLEQNKSNRELFVMDIDGQNKKQITCTPESEGNAVWINGGKQITPCGLTAANRLPTSRARAATRNCGSWRPTAATPGR